MGDGILEYELEGETLFGGDEVMIEGDDDLTRRTPAEATGYAIVPFLDQSLQAVIRSGIEQLIYEAARKHVSVAREDFSLGRYHDLLDDVRHLALVTESGLRYPNGRFPVDLRLVEERVSDFCGLPVRSKCPSLPAAVGEQFQVRIIRPQGKPDHNPPHRDVWLDRLRDGVNVYVPLIGSNARSSLALVAGSHRWKESEIERTVTGATINGISFTVPAVTGWRRAIGMIRPDPREGEMMIFSPYLIHGGGANWNEDVTRVSLEMRFWRRTA